MKWIENYKKEKQWEKENHISSLLNNPVFIAALISTICCIACVIISIFKIL